jgi:Ca-activated chloride channel family protein
MSDFRFANADWSSALWLVAAWVAVLFWLEWRRGAGLSRFLSATMQTRLVQRVSRTRRVLGIGCLGLAAAALVVALMRPQWGLTYQAMPRVGAQIMVCLDVSKSMLAEDTAPNRLGRAKAELTDLLTFLPGDQVGLIAFAGRASLLCPLTPDYGFFRLILDGAGPQSVGRGGTRLEEPIRKALDGFRTESDVSRILLLITDGEDHDSHPLDAANAAAERGVRIMAIGFGDEAGSAIEFTDPETGARTTIRDADGNPVISRLDGETLRQMALATDGVYIPAGTGALDLKSIHDAHIAPLVRGQLDDRGHAVRREGFQWAILVGLILLIASVLIGSGTVKSGIRIPAPAMNPARRTAAGVASFFFALWIGVGGYAQQEQQAPPEMREAKSTDGVSPAITEDDANSTSPRDAYNNALAHLHNDLQRAERLLTEARRESGTDGEVRFRATYNMGWVEVKRADKLLDEQPEEALSHLRLAADWFRDAVRLRPDNHDARHNLEVVLRRIHALADSLVNSEQRDLTQQLDALVEGQRVLLAASRQLVQQVADEEVDDPNAADRFRSEFRQLAIQQRKLLSESQALAKTAQEELETRDHKKDEDESPQDKVRAAQLDNLLHYMHQANQRLGQARSQMRRGQAERSFRRAAAGLTELKRARDQLRSPVETLDVLIGDSTALARLTALRSADSDSPLVASQSRPQIPAWLTAEFLKESQQALTERTAELTALLKAGLDQQASRPAGPPTPEEQRRNAQANQFLDKIRDALPFLSTAEQGFAAAGEGMAADDFLRAADQQRQAVQSLRAARERFLELRGLVELAYQTEVLAQTVLTPPDFEAKEELSDVQRANLVSDAEEIHVGNQQRSERIAGLIDEELERLPQTAKKTEGEETADPQASGSDPQQVEVQRQRMQLAKQLLAHARDEMALASDALRKAQKTREGESTPDDAPPDARLMIDDDALNTARGHVSQAVEQLELLRRLFFSLVDHLRETARRQSQLNDQTEQVVALKEDPEFAKQVGPISLTQKELQAMAQQIAEALDEQSTQQPGGGASPPGIDAKQLEQLQQISRQFAEAAKLVAEASEKMQEAGASLTADPPETAAARPHQDEALKKLVEALAMLTPEPQKQQNQAQQSRRGEGDDAESQEESGKEQQARGIDPARLLQAVRDRESQRRRDRENRQRLDREPVEKDW